MKLQPWELRRYTFKELFLRFDEESRHREDEAKKLINDYQTSWEQTRWLACNVANSMGAKITSVYSLIAFPWEHPKDKPEEDILSKFPKTLNNGR